MKNLISKSPLATATLVGVLAIAMTGCATKPSYRLPSQSGNQVVTNPQGVPNYYQVQRGDTVSQIASRYRLDYRQIGALNGLDSKYTIHTGQRLKLWQDNQGRVPNNSPAYNTNNPAPAPVNPNYNTPPTPPPVYTNTANATLGYEYPTRNPVIRNFDAQAENLGMWFSGREGDPVTASQSGTVLYAGNGLAEYGNLIMIRHSNNYITAYAHNSQLLVKEGDSIQRGQRIASMGSTGQTNQVALEFQVRLNGNPIDPRTVLGR